MLIKTAKSRFLKRVLCIALALLCLMSVCPFTVGVSALTVDEVAENIARKMFPNYEEVVSAIDMERMVDFLKDCVQGVHGFVQGSFDETYNFIISSWDEFVNAFNLAFEYGGSIDDNSEVVNELRIDGDYLVIYSPTRVSPIVDNNVIPTGYLITSATTDTRYRPFQAFNPNTIRGWQSSSHSYNFGIGTDYIQLQLPHARVVNRMALQNQREIIFDNRPDYNYGVVAPVDFILQGTNNYTSAYNADWETLLTISSRYDTGISQTTSYNINNTTAYRWYRLTVTRTTYNTSNNPVSIGQIGFWGMNEETRVTLAPELRNLSPNAEVEITVDDYGNVDICVYGDGDGDNGNDDNGNGGGSFIDYTNILERILAVLIQIRDNIRTALFGSEDDDPTLWQLVKEIRDEVKSGGVLKNLFVPSQGEIRNKFNGLKEEFDNKFPVIQESQDMFNEFQSILVQAGIIEQQTDEIIANEPLLMFSETISNYDLPLFDDNEFVTDFSVFNNDINDFNQYDDFFDIDLPEWGVRHLNLYHPFIGVYSMAKGWIRLFIISFAYLWFFRKCFKILPSLINGVQAFEPPRQTEFKFYLKGEQIT